MASKLVDMLKDLQEVEGGGSYSARSGGYNANMERSGGYSEYGRSGGYNEYGRPYMEGYNSPYQEGGYNQRGYREGGYNNRGYNGSDGRMRDYVERIREGAEMYEYGREKYQHGGSNDRMVDGLEKLMYAMCMFIESTMDFAQSPQEKEVIRKHVQKIRNI